MLAVSIPVEEHSLPRSIHNRFTGKQFLGRKDDRFPGPEAATTSLPRTQGRRNGIENGWKRRKFTTVVSKNIIFSSIYHANKLYTFHYYLPRNNLNKISFVRYSSQTFFPSPPLLRNSQKTFIFPSTKSSG